jgi:hypothetical protein
MAWCHPCTCLAHSKSIQIHCLVVGMIPRYCAFPQVSYLDLSMGLAALPFRPTIEVTEVIFHIRLL